MACVLLGLFFVLCPHWYRVSFQFGYLDFSDTNEFVILGPSGALGLIPLILIPDQFLEWEGHTHPFIAISGEIDGGEGGAGEFAVDEVLHLFVLGVRFLVSAVYGTGFQCFNVLFTPGHEEGDDFVILFEDDGGIFHISSVGFGVGAMFEDGIIPLGIDIDGPIRDGESVQFRIIQGMFALDVSKGGLSFGEGAFDMIGGEGATCGISPLVVVEDFLSKLGTGAEHPAAIGGPAGEFEGFEHIETMGTGEGFVNLKDVEWLAHFGSPGVRFLCPLWYRVSFKTSCRGS